MKFLITGGTGLVGSLLIPELLDRGHEVVNLSRGSEKPGQKRFSQVQWDGLSIPDQVEGINVVVNLAGANIGKRWTASYKKILLDSRVNATLACAKFINRQAQSVQLFISASGVNYYGSDFSLEKREDDALGIGFMSEICGAWEEAAFKANCRTITMRIPPVLTLQGGPLPKLMTPFKMFVGGPTGSGEQGFPWIHWQDLISLIHFFTEHTETRGPYNVVAPQKVSSRVFAQILGKIMKRPSFFRLPKGVLKLLFGEMSIVLWGGLVVNSEKVHEAGFVFQFPELEEALRDLVEK